MLLIDMSLFSSNPMQVTVDYMNYLHNSKELNLVAYSHFAGSTVKMYTAYPSYYAYMDYRNNNELSVYLFSRMFEYPKLFRKAMTEISFVVADKKDFDWAEQQRKDLNDNCKLYLQAEWSKREKVIPMIIDFVKENKDWAISLQSHKYMNIP